jgi:hypothetical protein
VVGRGPEWIVATSLDFANVSRGAMGRDEAMERPSKDRSDHVTASSAAGASNKLMIQTAVRESINDHQE